MKKITILTSALLLSLIGFSQEKKEESVPLYKKFNHSSIELNGGLTKFQDITPYKAFNVNLGYRYMLVPALGLRAQVGYINGVNNLTTASLSGVVNLTRLLPREQSVAMGRFSVLASAGGIVSRLNKVTNATVINQRSEFSMIGSLEVLYKLTDNLSLSASTQKIFSVNNRPSSVVGTQTTNISNINVGIVVGLGSRKKVHADWYIADEPKIEIKENDDFNSLEERVNLIDAALLEAKNAAVPVEVEEVEVEAIPYFSFHFNNNKSDIRDIDLYILENLVAYLKNNPEANIVLKGYASYPAAKDYNLKLSLERAEVIKSYLVKLGVSGDRVETESFGESDKFLNSPKMQSFERRVDVEFKN